MPIAGPPLLSFGSSLVLIQNPFRLWTPRAIRRRKAISSKQKAIKKGIIKVLLFFHLKVIRRIEVKIPCEPKPLAFVLLVRKAENCIVANEDN